MTNTNGMETSYMSAVKIAAWRPLVTVENNRSVKTLK